MKARLLASVLVGALAFTLPVAAQQEGKPAVDPQMKAMMEAMERFGTPGPEHQVLLQGVGTWDVESKMWMDPAAPPFVSKGVSTLRAILGGRYVQYDYEGDAMGMPFTGFGVSGYDRYNKKYVSLWLDSMSTGFALTEGACDAAGKVCTETGVWDDYTTGKKVKVKNVSTHLDNDHFTLQMFMVQPDGSEVKTMELAYTRRK
jgi:hypothetical protein